MRFIFEVVWRYALARVLLLEDDRDMSMLLRTLLEIEGYQVSTFEAMRPVLDQVRDSAPDVVLLDVHLGGQDGQQILRDIRKDPALKDVRVVMTSGINLTEECLRAGANAFIVKPYMPENLLALLRKVLTNPPGEKVSSGAKESPSASYPKVF
jgi:DNA-binding response OmpR family regulator